MKFQARLNNAPEPLRQQDTIVDFQGERWLFLYVTGGAVDQGKIVVAESMDTDDGRLNTREFYPSTFPGLTIEPAPVWQARIGQHAVRVTTDPVLQRGDTITDFRGDKWQFLSVTRAPYFGKEGRVSVVALGAPLRDIEAAEFYASVFPSLVIEQSPENAQPVTEKA